MKIIYIDKKEKKIIFEDGSTLSSYHEDSCCESHELDVCDLVLSDFYDLDFDLSNDKFFERVEDYGIRLIPTKGHPVSVPGYGRYTGYYSLNLTLILKLPDGTERGFDISRCQKLRDD